MKSLIILCLVFSFQYGEGILPRFDLLWPGSPGSPNRLLAARQPVRLPAMPKGFLYKNFSLDELFEKPTTTTPAPPPKATKPPSCLASDVLLDRKSLILCLLKKIRQAKAWTQNHTSKELEKVFKVNVLQSKNAVRIANIVISVKFTSNSGYSPPFYKMLYWFMYLKCKLFNKRTCLYFCVLCFCKM